MTYAILAAGEGSRLTAEGIAAHKPLVSLGGEKLIDRLVRIYSENGAERIVMVYRRTMDDVAAHIARLQAESEKGLHPRIEAVAADTPSSMHSMGEISTLLESGVFCLATVDSVFNEEMFGRYAAALKETVANGSADGVMAVTTYVDDERPLYVATDDDMNITAFLDQNDGCRYISAGIYGLTPAAISVLRACIDAGESRMRNFQRALLRSGLRLKAFDIGKAFDIDHAADIEKAERFLREGK